LFTVRTDKVEPFGYVLAGHALDGEQHDLAFASRLRDRRVRVD